MKGKLYVFSGPAGVGKGTILKNAMSKLPNMKFSVSCTTRSPRPGLDREGETYYFISEDEFRRRIDAGEFLEYADVHGHLYGTLRRTVEDALAEGSDIVLEIDVQGAKLVKEKMPEAVTIFVKPPSIEELIRRLKGRGSESAAEQALRIRNAEEELSHAAEYDHVIINDMLDRAVNDFIKIVTEYREETE